MNAAVRAVVRTALARGHRVFAIYEGYQGMVADGDRIGRMTWNSVGGILHQGGTVIGTARSERFRTREGRLQGGGELAQGRHRQPGGDRRRRQPHRRRHAAAGVARARRRAGRLGRDRRGDGGPARPFSIVGLVGSIDNDMAGTDMTIGADTALHRITEAIDAIASTAASHQRTFVVEVMGRHCGYLALMGAIAAGRDWVFIPESPPDVDDWEAKMCERAPHRPPGRPPRQHRGRGRGRPRPPRQPDHGRARPQVLQERLNEDVRVTILGHVQRGGAPSAFDRFMSTLLGHAAVEELLSVAAGQRAPAHRHEATTGSRASR